MPNATTPEFAPRRAVCPGCGKPVAAANAPFCGQGCRDRDLLRWLSDGHRIPGPADDDGLDGEDGLDSRTKPSL